jgi:hypothetical protein
MGRIITEQERYNQECQELGFKPEFYLKKAFVWAETVEDYVEASLIGFSKGRAKFAYVLESEMDEYEEECAKIGKLKISDKAKRKAMYDAKPKQKFIYLDPRRALYAL